MPSTAEWDSVYNKTLELLSKVKAILDATAGVKDYAKATSMLGVIANNITKMENDLNTLAGDAKYKLTDRDFKRRQNMIEGLKREKATRDSAIEKSGGNVQQKNQLLKGVNYDPESLTKRTDDDLHNIQQQTFAVQEQALEDISDTLGRLHEVGSAIGQEVDIQTKLLDEIDSNVGVANNRLQMETKRTALVTRKSSMCKMYSVVVLLLVILIFLVYFYIKM